MIEKLNTSQQQAVEQLEGPSLVLAGAGSGKTKVLTQKIAHIINQGIWPAEVLAVTFTNKAAREMQHRVAQTIGEDAAKQVWLGTFHSTCARILRRDIANYKSEAGLSWSNQFVIYDDKDSLALIKEAIKACNLDEKLYQPKLLMHQISNLKSQLVSPYLYASQASSDFRKEKMAKIYDAYERLLCRNNALDFDDLLTKTVLMLQQNPSILQRYHQQFKHVLVDEFQDTNDCQYELVRLIVEGCLKNDAVLNREHHWKGRSFTVVGDVDQSIYSWRGANFKIILNFQNDFPECTLIKLEENYRSTATILNLANAVIKNNKERLDKTLKAVRGQGSPVECYEAQDDRDEAHFVVDKFQQLQREFNLHPGDCCILYRTNAQSRTLEDVLISQGIPYTVVGGIKFYERKEIRDILAYLTVIFNPSDGHSLKRIINVPKRGVGNTSIQKLEALGNVHNQSLFETLADIDSIDGVQTKAKVAIKSLVAQIILWRDLVEKGLQLDELVTQVLETSGYLEFLKLEDPTDDEGRVENLEEFVNLTRQYLLKNPEGGLAGFLTQMALLTDLDTADTKENMLVLMTLHAAKGLEYPVVAMVGLEEGIFPHSRSLNEPDQMEEERRLMYVGITRAKDKLLITYARKRMVFGDIRFSVPSRFMRELPSEYLSGSYSLDQESDYYENRWRHDFEEGTISGRYNERKSYGQKQSSGYGQGYGYRANSYENKLSKNASSIPLAERDQPSAPKVEVPVNLLPKGTRVRHAKFGEGRIEQLLGEGQKAIYSIQFDTVAGKKLLDPKFAQLDVID